MWYGPLHMVRREPTLKNQTWHEAGRLYFASDTALDLKKAMSLEHGFDGLAAV